MATSDIQSRYQAALTQLVEKIAQDPYALAVILVGSLSYDVVWEKSDIDLMVITQDVKNSKAGLSLVEDGVVIHAVLMPRAQFKKAMAGAVQSSFFHSIMTKGRLLFARDETIGELFETRAQLGARDREVQLLSVASRILPTLTKAEKWLQVKQDPNYSFLYIMKLVESLAAVEVVQHGEVASREVIQQALQYNPAFFNAIYTDLVNQKKTARNVGQALDLINGYLQDRIPLLFKPLLDYLAASNGVRTATELEHHFQNQMNVEGTSMACEWLADQDIIQQVSAPGRLTDKSRVDVHEAAYYYEGGA